MVRLSIVIPVLGDTDSLEAGLVSVLEHRPADSEVIVVLNGEYSDPYDLKDEVRFVTAPRRAGLVQSLKAGWEASRGAILHTLGCGFEVSAGWSEAATRHFDDPQVGTVVPLLLSAAETSPQLVAAGVEYGPGGRRELALAGTEPDRLPLAIHAALGPVGLAAFYRAAALKNLPEAFTSAVGDQLADVDLALALRQAGYAAVLEPASRIMCDASRLTAARHGYRQSLCAERLFWRNAPGGSWPKALVAHGAAVARETLGSLPSPVTLLQVLGRVAGLMELVRHRRHHQKLEELQPALAVRPTLPSHARVDAGHAETKRSGTRAPLEEASELR